MIASSPTGAPRHMRGSGATAMLLNLVASGAIALLAIAPPSRAATAVGQDGGLVGLAYEAAPKVLLKAYGKALYQSLDQGKTWRQVELPLAKEQRIASVAASPARQGLVYVGGPGTGVLRSDDGGKTWSPRNDGLPTRDVVAIAAHTTQPDTIYAVLAGAGTFRSQDAGRTWRLMDRTSQKGLHQLIHSNMEGSMQTGWLYAATSHGVRRSMDCFCLWQDAGQIDAETLSVTFDPDAPKVLFAATEKGLIRSTDGGENWSAVKAPADDIVSVVSARSGLLFAIGKDGHLYRSDDAGKAWTEVHA